ncbi:hypothetical protein BLA29_013501 [Euroglyphus maynei]|uniref:Uncharacterized protein n=1 Tax=Euroglyphus maynei TaxID=6958 RepID=A0A1Y3B9U7_EURMA|nr:hypothetical protein BLA29_013501 [Euroglyphus maynei]
MNFQKIDLTNNQFFVSYRLDYIDPLNFARAQIRSLKINEERIRDSQKSWNSLMKEQVLREQIRIMMENFGVVRNGFQLDLVRMDPVQINDHQTSADQYQAIIYVHGVNENKRIKCFNQGERCLIPYLQIAFESKVEKFEVI